MMKFLFYLILALVAYGFIKHLLKPKDQIKTSVLIDGKPYKPSTDYDPEEERKKLLRVDPEGKNDGLNVDTDEKVVWEGSSKLYRTPGEKWFIVYHLRKGELSYQRITFWSARNFIKTRGSFSDQDREALLIKHNLTGTKEELHPKGIETVTRKYISRSPS